MDIDLKIDVIIVGAGISGLSAAITLARAGKKVVVIERGDFAGSKNVFGGAIYLKPAMEIFPDILEKAPVERINTQHRYAILSGDESTTITYNTVKKDNSATVIRADFDKWLAQKAKEEGVYLAPQTLVKSLIQKDGKVVGVKTELEEIYAPITIIAEGVNSILTRQIGLREKEIEPKNTALAVKEVLKLPKETIESRFNLKPDEGCVYEIIGTPMDSLLGLAYMYTNKESVSIGIGVSLEDLAKKKLKPYDLLNKLKSHPTISFLIDGAQLIEYSAHLIPEGGFNDMPKLFSNGVMVVGDAASFVNNVHWEGTNFAMISGKLAAQTAIAALLNNDFSSDMLSNYQKRLEASFVMKDLKSYKNVIELVHKRTSSFFGYWPHKICQFFDIFTSVDSIPKKNKFRNYAFSFFRERKFSSLPKDIITGIKIVFGVLK